MRQRHVAPGVAGAEIEGQHILAASLQVVAVIDADLFEAEVAAKAGPFERVGIAFARMGIIHVVAGIVDAGVGYAARIAEVFLAAFRSGLPVSFSRVTLFVVLRAVAVFRPFVFIGAVLQGQDIADIFAGAAAEGQFLADTFLVVPRDFIGVTVVVGVFVRKVVEGQRGRRLLFIDPGFRISEIVVGIVFAAEFPTDHDAVAGPPEVLVAQADHAHETVGITIAGADAEGTGALLDDADLHFHGVRFAARVQAYIDVLEEAQVVDALHGTPCQVRVERFALLEADFPQNDVILGLDVAFDLEVLDLAFVDQYVQRAVRQDAQVRHTGQDIALFLVFRFHLLDAFRHGADIDHLTRLEADHLFNVPGLDLGVSFNPVTRKLRILHNVVCHFDPFGHSLEGRAQVVEPAQGIDGLQIPRQGVLGQFDARFADDGGLDVFRLDFLVALDDDLRNRFVEERFQFRVYLFHRGGLRKGFLFPCALRRRRALLGRHRCGCIAAGALGHGFRRPFGRRFLLRLQGRGLRHGTVIFCRVDRFAFQVNRLRCTGRRFGKYRRGRQQRGGKHHRKTCLKRMIHNDIPSGSICPAPPDRTRIYAGTTK